MSEPSQSKICPKCGGPIPSEAPQGLCPKCLLLQASMPTEAGKGESSRPVPPTLTELAAAFPHLEILELFGQGGMGFVFKARQPKLDRFVALKILPQSLAADPAFAERFSREGRLLARLSHPNIVTVHDFGQANGFFYLLMEFVDGVNLRQAMQAGRFTSDQALAVVPKICEALQFAHNEGILHRDIKPENILLDNKGRVKIADFGIAKLVGEANAEATITGSGGTLGTPHYMAPEQIEKPSEVDHRADIYSLGVVFYEILTGELPLGRFALPSQKSGSDPRLDDVVLRALAKEPGHRTQTATDLKTQVETIVTNPRSASVEPEATSRPSDQSAGRVSQIIDWSWRIFCVVMIFLLLNGLKDSKAWDYLNSVMVVLVLVTLVELLIRRRRDGKTKAQLPQLLKVVLAAILLTLILPEFGRYIGPKDLPQVKKTPLVPPQATAITPPLTPHPVPSFAKPFHRAAKNPSTNHVSEANGGADRADPSSDQTGDAGLPVDNKEVRMAVAVLEQTIEAVNAAMKPYREVLNGNVAFAMVPIKGGEFVMGSPETEAGHQPDEGPQRTVRVASFWMGQCEVAWNEYELFMYPDQSKAPAKNAPVETADAIAHPTKPYVEMSFGMGKDKFPAISMTQHAANKYCEWLSAKTGHFYRLPTEAEWEYACRAGTTTAYSFGDDASKLDDYGV